MKKSIRPVFIAFLFLVVLTNGCAPAPTVSSAPPATSTPSPILPTATFTPIPITPTPYDKLASSDDKLRLDFFRKGGIWSFRISETETEWIIVILAQKSALDNKQKEIQLGSTSYSSPDGQEGAMKVLRLYDADTETWNGFIRLFADGIEQGEFDAFLVKTTPITGNNNVPLSVSVTLTKDSFLEVVTK